MLLQTMNYTHEKRATRPAPMPSMQGPGSQRRSGKLYPMALDPEDLTRRLYNVLAEQKAGAERRRRARGEADRQARGYGEIKKDKPTPHAVPHPRTFASRDPYMPGPLPIGQGLKESHEAPNRLQKRPEVHGSLREKTRLKKTDNEGEESNAAYQHVPQVAASQFTRTTTVDNVDDMTHHRLSKQAMKFHLDGPNKHPEVIKIDGKAAPFESARNLRMVQTERAKQYDRNQFQHPSILEAAVDEVTDLPPRLVQRHTFETYFRGKDFDLGAHATAKRSSSGYLISNRLSTDTSEAVLHLEILDSRENPEDHRVDWSQSDEASKSSEESDTPQLRRSQSKWTLKGRFGASKRQVREGKLSPTAEDEATEENSAASMSPRSPMTGFFSRFKR